MILVAKEDVLTGLKRFKRLAKQDFLASTLTSNPSFWTAQAESRREVYDDLSDLVERDGIESTYQRALEEYRTLPDMPVENTSPEIRGQKQALEMFFTLLGVVDPRQLNNDEYTPLEETLSNDSLERI